MNLDEFVMELSCLGKTDKRNTKDDTDYKLYTLRTFFKLAANADPNKIEWFFIPDNNILTKHKLWDLIKSHKDYFISKKLLHSFKRRE